MDQVRVGQLDDPQLKDSEVLLAVKAAALNHLDIHVRNGRPGIDIPMPHVLGSDAAGVVIAAGAGVHGIREGDEVILNPGLSCGCCEFCLRGEHSLCTSFGIVGLSRPGTFAEKVAVPFWCVRPKPAYLTFEEAAALPLATLTAWRMLMTRCRLQAGDTVLIHGIGGGVALAGLGLALMAGAEVIVTSSSTEKLGKASRLGAHHTIDYTAEDVAARVRQITQGRGVDVAMDSVGAATWPVDFAAVRKGGMIVLCGVTSGAAAETDLQALYWNQLTIMGSTMGSAEDFRRMLAAVKTANFKPVIDSVMSIDDAAKALSKMETGDQFGKIVLKIAQQTQ